LNNKKKTDEKTLTKVDNQNSKIKKKKKFFSQRFSATQNNNRCFGWKHSTITITRRIYCTKAKQKWKNGKMEKWKNEKNFCLFV
jgi:hypothetical protein